MTIARPDERLRRWPVGMALEIVVYLLVMAVAVVVALGATLFF